MKSYGIFYALALSLFSPLATIAGVGVETNQQFYLRSKSHFISAIAIDASSFQIEDGSEWTVPSGYISEVLKWKCGDLLELRKNRRWWKSAPYFFENTTRKSIVEASLHLGPFVDNPYTKEVVEIDRQKRLLVLQDGSGLITYWKVDRLSKDLLKKWRVHDAVIVGNSGIPNYEAFLINVEANIVVDAKEQ